MSKDKRARRNKEIRVPEVRLIDQHGEQLGVLDTRDAIVKAQEAGLDLVEVSPNVDPPVCKIMDFGKFVFERSKATNNAKKHTKRTQLKEIKFRPGTDIGDYNVKLKKLTNFLEVGDKIKVTVRFRGREMAHQNLGMDLMNRVKTDLEELGNIEQEAKSEGRQMVMVMAPKKKNN